MKPPARPTVTIEYQDADGVVTERDVTVLDIVQKDDGGPIYLKAHCHVRDGRRSFRLDRIRWIEMRDGKRLDVPEFLRSFGAEPSRSRQPRPSMGQALIRIGCALMMLPILIGLLVILWALIASLF